LLAGGKPLQKGMSLCNPFFFLLVDSVLESAGAAWACEPLAVPALAAAGDAAAVDAPLWEEVVAVVVAAAGVAELTTSAAAGGGSAAAGWAAAGAGASAAAGAGAAAGAAVEPAPGASRI
jgi:hypothetical protein